MKIRIDRSFLFSKVGRRIFWLFVLCALIPMAILSAVSVLNVTSQLTKQSHELLQQTSREEAMNIYAHLTFLEADMRVMGPAFEAGRLRSTHLAAMGAPQALENRFRGLALVQPDGQREILYGKMARTPGFTKEDRQFLDSGKTLLSTGECAGSVRCVFLSQEVRGRPAQKQTLVAEVRASYLWDADDLPLHTDLCVLDDVGRVLYCPGMPTAQLPAEIGQSFSGQFDWKKNRDNYFAEYWSVPLKPRFLASHWTVIASEARSDALAPLIHFKRSFLLTVLLAFWVVLLLSLIQIRRSMVPLTRLQEGTRRLTRGELGARVSVPGNDEFTDLASSFNSMAARIEKQVNSLRTDNEIDRAILSSWNFEQIVDALILRLRVVLPYEHVSISLFDARTTSRAITYVSAAGAEGEKQVQTITLSAEDVAALGNASEPSIVSLEGDLPSYFAPIRQCGMRFCLVVPVLLNGKLAAIISLGHRSAAPWTEEDKRGAVQLADRVAVAISNARLIEELKQLHLGTLTALARAIDAKSHWTSGHSERVTSWALKIAEAMGLPEQELEIIHRGGLLHDIGKIGTPVEVLDKSVKLNPEEMAKMREHVRVGASILEPIPDFIECLPIVMQHHEWMNGHGYPDGLAGEEIHLHARILAVADCYDALISDRPYRSGMPRERVAEIIREGSGKQFDPRVVEIFLQLLAREHSKPEAEEAMAMPLESI